MSKSNPTVTILSIGKNELFIQREKLQKIVDENFNLLWEGAVRLGHSIEPDYYCGALRIQVGRTRLHHGCENKLKYADGHKYSSDAAPTEAQLRQTAADLQKLINAAAAPIGCSFDIQIKIK